jgi:competence protein ComEC
VVAVTAGNSRFLLAGDIERQAELSLLSSGVALAADVLLVPHHGSKTSSSPAFINAVAPALAIVSAGQYNRFSHPDERVQQRYHDRGVRLLNTATSGQIDLIKPAADQNIIERRRLCCYRHYWQ